MPANRLYYSLKPYLPWSFRMALRRIVARRKLKDCQDIWPINEAAGNPPDGWPGWPDGKKFAVVLTHDVEGPEGLAKCRRLMRLEKELGFHSSFNLIPEGDYAVSRELRDELSQNGFEIGVHDLHHDGKLFQTRQDFSKNAREINRYLKEWGAAGFRSGFMLRELNWLQDLNIQYDASTFDTDPFEPQPDGTGTIFPFWVPAVAAGSSKFEVRRSMFDVNSSPSSEIGNRKSEIGNQRFAQPSAFSLQPSRSGYVELPYTLAQDSTLFLVMRERTPRIWLQKLDWIARRGGMALVNVHPDYLRFPDEPASPRTYPVELYIELLKHIKNQHAGTYWQPLPRDAAAFCSQFRLQKPAVSNRRIGMVVYSVYKRDNRVIRYAEALAARGDTVEVISLKQNPADPGAEKVGSVQVYRVQGRYSKNQRHQGEYLLPILWFWALASVRLAWRHVRHRYDLIHVHNMPDFLAFAAWFPKLTGAKIILDVHDIMPEFYASKFQKAGSAFGVSVLKRIERASARFADHVIISNHLWLKPFIARSAPEQKCSVFINYVNQDLFYRRPHAANGDKRIIMFPGGLQWHQGLDIAIRAMPAVLRKIPDAEFHIHGDGNRKDELVQLTRDLGLTDKVRFFEPRPVSEIAGVMSQADLGVVPKRADSFGNEAYSTKIMEFMSLGVPMVVSSTKIDRFYFNDSVVRFFESGNSDALAEAIIEVLSNDDIRQRMIANALEYASQNNWQRRQAAYLELVDALIENRPVTLDGGKPDVPAGNSKDDRNGQAVDLAGKTEPLAVH
jgi:glycosyltransferase involved in cell wall biosynthesis